MALLRNPWNSNRTAAGSPGGDAVALTTGMSALGLTFHNEALRGAGHFTSYSAKFPFGLLHRGKIV